jgi:deoxyribodipyrimidine photo-lyase
LAQISGFGLMRSISLTSTLLLSHFRLLEIDICNSRNLLFKSLQDLPDIYTTYRKLFETLRNKSCIVLLIPDPNSLPPFPPKNALLPQYIPFTIPTSLEIIKIALLKPLTSKPIIKDSPSYPAEAQSIYPF